MSNSADRSRLTRHIMPPDGSEGQLNRAVAGPLQRLVGRRSALFHLEIDLYRIARSDLHEAPVPYVDARSPAMPATSDDRHLVECSAKNGASRFGSTEWAFGNICTVYDNEEMVGRHAALGTRRDLDLRISNRVNVDIRRRNRST